jgi:hypothetical protein
MLPRNDVILACDPGRSSGTIIVRTDLPPIRRSYCQYSYDLPPIQVFVAGVPHPTKVVTELQWLHGAKNKRAILTLAFDAGMTLKGICDATQARGYALPVEVWKRLLFSGSQSDKLVHLRRIEHLLTPNEAVQLSEGPRKWDELSAAGIGWAAYLLGPKLEGYRKC